MILFQLFLCAALSLSFSVSHTIPFIIATGISLLLFWMTHTHTHALLQWLVHQREIGRCDLDAVTLKIHYIRFSVGFRLSLEKRQV